MEDLLAWKEFGAETALVLGSGLGPLADQVRVERAASFAEVPGLPVSKVPGHAGRLLLGVLGGRRVIVAVGRVHLYEGHNAAAVTAQIRLMAALGVRRVILTNAAGTLNEANPPGSWLLLSDHLNLTATTPLLGGPNFIDMTTVYTAAWRARAQAAATAQGWTLREGVYAGVLGPQYETPAEIRAYRALGADAVGMSTVLEAIQARALGLDVLGLSCLTNWAAGMSGEALHHGEVMETGKAAAGRMLELLPEILG